ncbi:MAG: glycosyltransferase family 4 protein [Candidatus Nanohaloarchaea archaeon]
MPGKEGKLEILMLCLFLPSAQRSNAVRLAEELQERGHRVHVVTGGGFKEMDTGLDIHRVPIRKFENRFLDSYLNFAMYLFFGFFHSVKLHSRHDIDVVRANFIDMPGLTAYLTRRALGTPYVVYAHGRDILENPRDLDVEEESRLKRWLDRKVLSGADLVMTESEFMAEFIGMENETHVVPPGVDMEKHRPGEKKDFILSVGDFTERKNFATTIEGFRKADTGMELLLVGEGPKREELEQEHAGEDVKFLGRVEEEKLLELFTQARAFVLPSLFEPIGNVYLEALSSGTPVIAPRATSGIEEFIEDGREGILVNPESSREVSGALERILESEKDWTEAARESSERFSKRKIADRMEQIYLEAA